MLLMTMLLLPIALRWDRLWAETGSPPQGARNGCGIDPNEAPWWELALLPEIGPVRAEGIAAHRALVRAAKGESAKPFERPEDLEWVHGIGPTIRSEIEPYLRFASIGTDPGTAPTK